VRAGALVWTWAVVWTWAAWGAAIAAGLGGVAGLVIGLLVHPPTAVFAAFEVAIPATAVGFLVGFGCGAVVGRPRRRHQDAAPGSVAERA
jgi:hypothetical protein